MFENGFGFFIMCIISFIVVYILPIILFIALINWLAS